MKASIKLSFARRAKADMSIEIGQATKETSQTCSTSTSCTTIDSYDVLESVN